MKKEILLLALLTSTVISAAAQQSDSLRKNNINPDTLAQNTKRNEIGLLIGGYHFNSFAPESYLCCFNMNLSTGVSYKRYLGGTAFRLGFSYSTQTLNNDGGKWIGESSITGKEVGSFGFVGVERTFFQKGIFRFYAGIDAAMASYSFNGYSVNYDETNTLPEQKQMNSIGINPFYGFSLKLSNRIKISAESNIDNWFVKENTTMTDPTRIVTTHHFTCAPNPLNAIYLSFLF